MTAKARRSPEPKRCDCLRSSHVCGTRAMYDVHKCGCDPCLTAKRDYSTEQSRGVHRRPKRTAPASDAPVTERGAFVATFPVHGGVSESRAARQAYDQLLAMTKEQGVVVKGPWQFRLEQTRAGRFLTARAPAETTRPRSEVLATAEHFAYEHERAHPALASWVSKHLEEVAA